MKQSKKQHYVAPLIEVVAMENEGVIAASSGGSLPNVGDGGSAFGTYSSSGASASSSDIEEMINEILTY
ncbi:MAG: hypothetical protein ACI4C3_01280 [Bacteroides sp.]